MFMCVHACARAYVLSLSFFLSLRVVMYAVKPWGKVLLVGSGVGAYAMGIGMRWRESNVQLVEKRRDPSHELSNRRRCVITSQTLKLLRDLGCTNAKVERILQKAKGWRFVRPDLETIREGSIFPGCADGESVYHCAEGALQRTLRTEYLRFGGDISWETEAFDAFETGDGSGAWSLQKMYGLETEAEAIITTAKGTSLASLVIADDPDRLAVLFDEETGVSPGGRQTTERIFGAADVVIVVGSGLVIHMWHADNVITWRLIRKARREIQDLHSIALHPAIQEVLGSSTSKSSRVLIVPATTPAIKDSARDVKVSVLGDGLLPVDPFEWRGDRARCGVEEASALCRAFYGKKYHRGNVPRLLREVEQDALAKRAAILARDLRDAEHFLAVLPIIDGEDHAHTESAFSQLPK
ncbi:hypothetical protein, conserved [Trypanosoma brucei gambiense DAL972]|uniref:FAD-binding domain-containing protein n=1 Tax=Trypanosoma brucei gambiense (strain MHOM/CI/86/DAL972) TaxID=679716 RepID=C9ZWI4_TRYB9|nr:hypothetical protein, conserved [Trypanosoma brucei gambiense DAL972]CBH13773.1 hypothetical protein, conserved [Trypanosoma brucei gambiense DAL972]|eukprot:XP_011776049.1 hypothetical protein, conserved [Trypanosoma brucei gambiense DAL972]